MQKSKLIAVALSVSVAFLSINTPVKADNPSEKILSISTPTDLKSFSTSVANGTDYKGYTISIEKDIDMSGVSWTPIGTSSHPFTGSIMGNNHTIANLSGQSFISYMDVCDGNQFLVNINIDNYKFNNGRAAGLISNLTTKDGGKLVISNCKASGTMNAEGIHAGGLISCVDTTNEAIIEIRGCRSNMTVTSKTGPFNPVTYAIAGGIICENSCSSTNKTKVIISECESAGVMDLCVRYGLPSSYAGGIVGVCSINDLTIEKCAVTCNMTTQGADAMTGGIIGTLNIGSLRSISINNCYVNASVNAYKDNTKVSWAAGFIGRTSGSYNKSISIHNCYFTGSLGTDRPAGFISFYTPGTCPDIANCYFDMSNIKIGKNQVIVSPTNESYDWTAIYKNDANIKGSYGCSSDDMKKIDTYNNWDFDSIWLINELYNGGYPCLRCLDNSLGENEYAKEGMEEDGCYWWKLTGRNDDLTLLVSGNAIPSLYYTSETPTDEPIPYPAPWEKFSSIVKHIVLVDIQSIGEHVFYEFSNAEDVTIPSETTLISKNAFYGCLNLSIVNYGGNTSDWKNIKIEEGNDSLIEAFWDQEEKAHTLDDSSDIAIINEVRKYTDKTDYAQFQDIIQSDTTKEIKFKQLNELFHNQGITNVNEGIKSQL